MSKEMSIQMGHYLCTIRREQPTFIVSRHKSELHK